MKKDIHPKYHQVLFIDSTTDYKFICGSTLQPKETAKFEGKEYPVSRLATSSSSHPFFTGSNKLVDAEGRVEKFKKRYAASMLKVASEDESATEDQPKEEAPAKEKPAKAPKKK